MLPTPPHSHRGCSPSHGDDIITQLVAAGQPPLLAPAGGQVVSSPIPAPTNLPSLPANRQATMHILVHFKLPPCPPLHQLPALFPTRTSQLGHPHHLSGLFLHLPPIIPVFRHSIPPRSCHPRSIMQNGVQDVARFSVVLEWHFLFL